MRAVRLVLTMIPLIMACGYLTKGGDDDDDDGEEEWGDGSPSSSPSDPFGGDSDGNGNTAPEVTIFAPGDGSAHSVDDTIDFVAQAEDAEDGPSALVAVWRSDIDGVLSEELSLSSDGSATFSMVGLSVGDHQIMLEVTDSGGSTGDAAVSISVEDSDFRPRITMVHPTGTETGQAGSMFEFVAEVHDGQDDPGDLDITFESSEDGEFCHPTADNDGIAVCQAALSEGTHYLEYKVTDTEGNANRDPEVWSFTVEAFAHTDDDGDGFDENTGDCDDDDYYVNPGATETPYDGIDQDCDGSDLTDVDGDGHDAEVVGGDDCNDTATSAYPGADEYCDSVDNDCDGVVDEVDAIGCTSWYNDEDDDGYGVFDDAVCSCGPTGDYTASGTEGWDCEDDASDVNPGYEGWEESETPGGNWDWNCDGVEERELEGYGFCSGGTSCFLDSEGWDVVTPACGESGFWVDGCAGFTCEASGSTRIQRCR